jgi:hypothetical protein
MADERAPEDWELIDDAEPPVTPREFDEILAKHGLMTRSQRRLAWRAIHDAGLLIFKA